MEADIQEANGWQPWDPTVFVANNGVSVQAPGAQEAADHIPQHPQVPQHLMDLDLSGSLMKFLRENGPDIQIEEVMLPFDGSPSSSDATSIQIDEATVFNVVTSLCAKIILFHRNDLPGSDNVVSSPTTIALKPILIDGTAPSKKNTNEASQHASSLQIVPWHPIPAVLLLLTLPKVLKARQNALSGSARSKEEDSVLIIDQQGVIQILGSEDDSGPTPFEFEVAEERPSPTQRSNP
jgi:hypothetical protein